MQVVSYIADFAGIISLVLGIVTLRTTVGIRKNLLIRIEKSDFIQVIDSKIANLNSYHDTMTKDEVFYDENLLYKIDMDLDDIIIAYGTILPNYITSQIRKLRAHIKDVCLKDLNNKTAMRDCAKMLHSLASKLAKEKKLL